MAKFHNGRFGRTTLDPDRARLYSINNLKSLTESYANEPMETTEAFGKYYRAFCKIAYFLKSKDRISDRETSIYFLQGFHPDFHSKVLTQLRAESLRITPTTRTKYLAFIRQRYLYCLAIIPCRRLQRASVQSTSNPYPNNPMRQHYNQ